MHIGGAERIGVYPPIGAEANAISQRERRRYMGQIIAECDCPHPQVCSNLSYCQAKACREYQASQLVIHELAEAGRALRREHEQAFMDNIQTILICVGAVLTAVLLEKFAF